MGSRRFFYLFPGDQLKEGALLRGIRIGYVSFPSRMSNGTFILAEIDGDYYKGIIPVGAALCELQLTVPWESLQAEDVGTACC